MAAIAVGGTLLVGGLSVGTANAAPAKKGCLTLVEKSSGFAYYHRVVGDSGFYCDSAMIQLSVNTYGGKAAGKAAPAGLGDQPLGSTLDGGSVGLASDLDSVRPETATPATGKGPNGEELINEGWADSSARTCANAAYLIDGVQYFKRIAEPNKLYKCNDAQMKAVGKGINPGAGAPPVDAGAPPAEIPTIYTAVTAGPAPADLVAGYARVAFDHSPDTLLRKSYQGNAAADCKAGYVLFSQSAQMTAAARSQIKPNSSLCGKVNWDVWLAGAKAPGGEAIAKADAQAALAGKAAPAPANNVCAWPYNKVVKNACALNI